MKNLIAFLRSHPLIFVGQSTSMKLFWKPNFLYLNAKRKNGVFEEEGETVGAISYSSEFDFLPSEHGVLIHFNCEDIAQTLEKVLQKGGKVVIPRTKIEVEGRGWFAVFTDCEGNRIGIYAEK